MDQDLLKTSTKQRVIIAVIAILMLGSMIASYAAIVMGKNNNSTSSSSDPLIAKYEGPYTEAVRKVESATKSYFNDFVGYKGEVVAYNEVSANGEGLKTRDLKVGDGRELVDGDKNYLAFYVGWCADETIFDSSYDTTTNPSAFARILDPGNGLIEGWDVGVIGMKLGGIREVTIPGELAYGESREICGGTNKPLKFIIMAVDKTEELSAVSDELSLAETKLQYAYYGLDYDEMMSGEDEEDYEDEELAE